jgi:hypothetical protein
MTERGAGCNFRAETPPVSIGPLPAYRGNVLERLLEVPWGNSFTRVVTARKLDPSRILSDNLSIQ